jgi:hypothetical protein
VELAIDEGKMTFNPFAEVVAKGDDELRRKPLTENARRKFAHSLLDNKIDPCPNVCVGTIRATNARRPRHARVIASGRMQPNLYRRCCVVRDKTERRRQERLLCAGQRLQSRRPRYWARRRWRQVPWRLTVAATAVAATLVGMVADILPVTVVADILQEVTVAEVMEVAMAAVMAATKASMVTAAMVTTAL